MATTTIRVDTETHARFVALSRSEGRTLIEVLRDAAEALERQRFARQVTGEMDRLRSDPDAWAAYINDAESLPVSDGIG